MKEKNSKNIKEYEDILYLSRPVPSSRHPRMPLSSRAKIFSPFAALRGYEEEIAAEDWKLTRTPQKFLSEEDIDRLSGLLFRIRKGMLITVRYFQEDTLHPSTPPLGTYLQITGTVIRIDLTLRVLHILCENETTVIYFKDLENLMIHE